MAHPYAGQSKSGAATRLARVNGTTVKARATGGRVKHDDEVQDKALIKKLIKEDNDEGGKARLDRPARKCGGEVKRAMGGVVKHKKEGAKKKGATNVNVIVAPQDKGAAPPPGPVTPAPPVAGPAAIKPPLPPGGPVGLPPGGPVGLPPRKRGGRVSDDAKIEKYGDK